MSNPEVVLILRRRKYTFREIASLFGKSTHTVRKWYRQA